MMFELTGKYSSAKVFVKDETKLEDSAKKQIQDLLDNSYVDGSKISIMPDCHAGKGCVIGFTQTLPKKTVIPSLVGCDIGCFTKDTKVKLADGRDVSFENLVKEHNEGKEHYGYSFNSKGNIVISKLDLPRKIKVVDEIVKVTLDNGEIIQCTPDHIFYDIKRNEIEAKDLYNGVSLFPLYIDIAKNHKDKIRLPVKGKLKPALDEYNIVFQPNTYEWDFCHFLADDYNVRCNGLQFNGSYVRHHIDFNKYNNNPTNIQRMSFKDHWIYHANHAKELIALGKFGYSAVIKKHPNIASIAGEKSAESTWHGKNADKNRKKFSERVKRLNESGILNSKEQRERLRQRQLTNNTTKFSEQNKDYAFQNKQKLSKLRKVLRHCGNNFSKESYNNARQFVYNAFTHDKALEILKENNLSFEELCGYKNHKVVSVETLKKKTDVYCLTCFEFGNFALSSGVFVHNCGMLTLHITNFEFDKRNLGKLNNVCHHDIPSGFSLHSKPLSCTNAEHGSIIGMEYGNMKEELQKMIAPIDLNKALCSVGTLGSGNHFISVEKCEKSDDVYLVIHTGSRHLGLEVEGHYTSVAKTKYGEDNSFAILDEIDFDNYIHDMAIAQKFASLNRQAICKIISDTFKWSAKNLVEINETVHNYIDLDSMIVRKGAISLKKDEIAIIPMNMADGSLIVRGKGNPDWNYSGPHGAGRLMSRAQARKTLSMDDFKNSMKDVYTTTVSKATLDESKMAYKPMEDIVNAIGDTCEILETIKPIYNFKAS